MDVKDWISTGCFLVSLGIIVWVYWKNYQLSKENNWIRFLLGHRTIMTGMTTSYKSLRSMYRQIVEEETL